MKHHFRIAALGMLLAAWGTRGAALAQYPADPTKPSPALREAMEAEQPDQSVRPGGGPPTMSAIPALTLKGRIVCRRHDPVALIGLGEKEGRLVQVRAGHEYPLSVPGGGGSVVLHVLTITPREVEVEVLPLKKRFILQ